MQDPIEIVRQALAEEAKTDPAERFERLVRSKIIDSDGELIRHPDAPVYMDRTAADE